MGRLTTAMEDAIRAKAAIAQVFRLKVPTSSLHSVYLTGTFDDAHAVLEPAPRRRVIRAGKRKVDVWNPHISKSGVRPKASRYTIEVNNKDGWWHPGPGTAFRPFGYQAQPEECFLVHRVYVDVNGTWTEFEDLEYVGRIIKIEHSPTMRDGELVPATALLTAEQGQAWSALRRKWRRLDADSDQVTDGTSGDLDYQIT